MAGREALDTVAPFLAIVAQQTLRLQKTEPLRITIQQIGQNPKNFGIKDIEGQYGVIITDAAGVPVLRVQHKKQQGKESVTFSPPEPASIQPGSLPAHIYELRLGRPNQSEYPRLETIKRIRKYREESSKNIRINDDTYRMGTNTSPLLNTELFNALTSFVVETGTRREQTPQLDSAQHPGVSHPSQPPKPIPQDPTNESSQSRISLQTAKTRVPFIQVEQPPVPTRYGSDWGPEEDQSGESQNLPERRGR